MEKMKKKGTHVGIMISFNLFILFLISIFLFITPSIGSTNEKERTIEEAYSRIIENVSSNLTITIIKLEDSYTPQKECFSLINGGWTSLEEAIVKNLSENIINSSKESNSILIDWKGDRLLKIYSSEEEMNEFPITSEDCSSSQENSDFEVSLIQKEKYPFESNIKTIEERYLTTYSNLKESLNIPPREDFGIEFKNSEGGEIFKLGSSPSSREVYTKEFDIIYINNESSKKLGKIILSVW